MSESLRLKIRDLVQNSGYTLAAILREFPEHPDPWQVRMWFADAKREYLHQQSESLGDSAPARVFTKKGLEAMNAGWMRPIVLQFDTPKVAPPKVKRNGKVTLVCSDIHEPDSDPHAMDVFYQIGQYLNASDIVVNGDWFDVASLSRFTPNAEQHLRWVEERKASLHGAGGPVMMRQQFPDARIRFLPGNHDVRPLNWVNTNAMPLMGLFTLDTWLGIDDPKLNIELVTDGTVRLANGSLIVKHGTKVSKHSGYSVKKEVDDMGMSVIMGHVHRIARVEVTKGDGDLIGIELGCLCKLRPHYSNKEDVVNWQQGFAVVTEFEDGDFGVELVKITEGKAIFRGLQFRSRVVLAGEALKAGQAVSWKDANTVMRAGA